MHAIVRTEFLAGPVRAILDHLWASAAAGRDLRSSNTVRQLLHYFDFSSSQRFEQPDARFIRHLDTLPDVIKLRNRCAGNLKKEGRPSGLFLLLRAVSTLVVLLCTGEHITINVHPTNNEHVSIP